MCNQSCGTGLQERSRSCTQPAPSHGGKACHGHPGESRECNTHLCPGKNIFMAERLWAPLFHIFNGEDKDRQALTCVSRFLQPRSFLLLGNQ